MGILSLRTPPPRSADAPAGVFSAGRALRDLDRIAVRPRPTGSAEAAKARAALFARMQALGLHPRIEVGEAVESGRRPRAHLASGGRVENLIGVLEGRDPSAPVVLLMAHTDSVPASPGAADDGTGVVAALEAVRALSAQGPHRRSVALLLTDGEEEGLLGARAFFASADPLRPRIGAVVNLEARGGGGRTTMFETGAENGAYMRLFARAVPHADAISLMSEIYKTLPNDTDFTIARRSGLGGFNFAFIGALADYHAPSSTIAALDKGSLQHMGDQALAVTGALADAPSLPGKAPDAVFGDLFGGPVLVYPQLFGWALLLIGGGLGAMGAGVMIRQGREGLSAASLLGAVLGPWLPVLLAALALHLLHLAMSGDVLKLRALLDETALVRLAMGGLLIGAGLWSWRTLWRGEGRLLIGGASLCAFVFILLKEGVNPVFLSLAAATALLSLIAYRPLPAGLGYAGSLLQLFLFALLLQILSPGVAVLAAWPLVIAGAAGASVALFGRGDAGSGGALGALAALGLLLIIHLVRLGGMIADGVSYFLPEALAVLLLLGGAALHPLAEGLGAEGPLFALPGPAIGALGAAALALALVRDPFTARTPRPVEAFYLEDAGAGRAFRASSLARLDPWSKAVLEGAAVPTPKAYPPAFDLLELSPAPLAGLPRPNVTITSTRAAEGFRVLVKIAPGLLAREVRVFLQPEDRIDDVRVDGLETSLQARGGETAEARWVAPSAGLEVSFLNRGQGPVRLTLETVADGLPAFMSTPPLGAAEAPSPRSGTSVLLDERVIRPGSAS